MLRLIAVLTITASLAAQPLLTRTIAEIPAPAGEGAAGRLLLLEQRGDETIAIRTRVPFFVASAAELAVSRIAGNGVVTTQSIAPIDAPNGIYGGDGAITDRGYLVAWNDGGVHTAFIDSSFRLQTATTLPSYSSYPPGSMSRNVAVRCTARRCLVAWWEYGPNDARLAASLLDTSGNVLAARIELGDIFREPFTVFFSIAASSSRFMAAAWTGPYDKTQMRVIPIDENGRTGTPVTLFQGGFSPQAIDSLGDDFVVVRAIETADGAELLAESFDAAGAVREAWHTIAFSHDVAPYALHLRCRDDVKLLGLESAPDIVGLIEGVIPSTNLNVIRLGSDLHAIDKDQIAVSTFDSTNDSPKFVKTARGYVIGWNHGAAAGQRSYNYTSPRFAELAAAGPAPPSLNDGHPLLDGPGNPFLINSAVMGDQYAVLRQELASRTTPATALTVSLVNRIGVTRDRIVISDRPSWNPSMASDGYDALIAWSESSQSFRTRPLRRDGSLGRMDEHVGDILSSELIWDDFEYAALTRSSLSYDYKTWLRTFDSAGSSRRRVPVTDLGQPRAISGSGGRIAVVWDVDRWTSNDPGTFVTIIDARSSAILGKTRLTTELLWNASIITVRDRFLAFVQTAGKLSVFEIDRDGSLLRPDPLVIPLQLYEFTISITPVGNRIAIVTRFGAPLLRLVDVTNRLVADPIPLPDPDAFVRADPGIGGSALTLSSHRVRGEEMEGSSTIVREWSVPADPRRRSF